MLALEDLVALAVLDLEDQLCIRDRLQVECSEAERADVDDLAGLVERLVADEQHLRFGLDLHLPFEFLLAQR